jgi:serine protease Do
MKGAIMKKIFIAFCLLIPAANLFSQQANLREAVVVVRPIFDDETLNFLNEFAVSLSRDGHYKAADILRAYARGGFGSGFVYRNSKDGKAYVITNRHVVTQAERVSIEFMTAGRESVKYENCSVVAVHDNLDVAIVAMPSNYNARNSLIFSTGKLRDGSDVFTAGFPGLGSDPSWQLGRGIVSNADVYIPELTNDTDVNLIQHTAQVDVGSSGGPLLVASAGSPFGYQVVGINTWKAIGRENVNFAIPVSAVRSIADGYLNSGQFVTSKALEQRAKDMLKARESDYKKVLPFVSYKYASKLAVAAFYDLLNAASPKVREDIISNLENGFPVEGVRIAIADAICKNLVSDRPEFSSVDNLTNGEANVLLKQNGKTITCEWVTEQGVWRIVNLPLLNLKTKSKSSDTSSSSKNGFNYDTSMRLGIGTPVNTDHLTRSYNLTILGTTYYSYITRELNLSYTQAEFFMKDEWNPAITTLKNFPLWGADLYLGLQYPLKIADFYLIPRAKVFGGGEWLWGDLEKTSRAGWTYGFSGVLELAYTIAKGTYMLGGIGYTRKIHKSLRDDELTLKDPFSTIDIYIGITW